MLVGKGISEGIGLGKVVILKENEIKIDPSDDFPYDRIPNKKNYKFAVGKYQVLFYEYKNYVIWGITAQILRSFLNIIK